MLFNSINFVVFFIVVTTLYFAIPHKYRWLLLLISSCYFYMAFVPVYILILGFTIIIDYFVGIWLEDTAGRKRKLVLIISLIANVAVLAVFKYYNFLNDNLSQLLNLLGYRNTVKDLSILLPIGLFFHTFQAMSYTIEVYRGNQKAERDFGIYSLYVMFYPQLVAGPIERPQNLLHQFREEHHFDYGNLTEGLKQMLWGFFKKLVIADRLAVYVNSVYGNPQHHSGATFAVATIFFAFQIYCDFSGYSNIAIGAARVMGFKLMTNFNRPYFSRSISEFWKRWHISLSTWFKDYLYISLGGNKVSIPRWYLNLLLVFVVSGLWHGANRTYIIWGALNGVYLVFAIVFEPLKRRFNNVIGLSKFPALEQIFQIITTFILICFSWIFFRANTLKDAIFIVKKIFVFDGPVYFESLSIPILSLSAIVFLLFVEFKWQYLPGKLLFMHHKNWLVRNLSYTFLLILILLVGVFNNSQFIYFQF
jgi:alginate O-acetyltransferase complex protein AlgI